MSEEVKVERKKRSLSLIQPTSIPTLGNYLGAMKGWSDFQEEYDTIYGVADLHPLPCALRPAKACGGYDHGSCTLCCWLFR